MYNGLPIATNKVTEEEQLGVKHHLLGIFDPSQITNMIGFRDLALPLVCSTTIFFTHHQVITEPDFTNYRVRKAACNCWWDKLLHSKFAVDESK